jgi:hypothetical protein
MDWEDKHQQEIRRLERIGLAPYQSRTRQYIAAIFQIDSLKQTGVSAAF